MKPDVSVTDDERRRCRGVLKQGGTAEETFGSFVLAVFLDYVLIHGYDAWSEGFFVFKRRGKIIFHAVNERSTVKRLCRGRKVLLFIQKGRRRGAGGFL